MASVTIYNSNKMTIRYCDNRKSIYIQEFGNDDPFQQIRIFVDERNISQFFAALDEIAARLAMEKEKENE